MEPPGESFLLFFFFIHFCLSVCPSPPLGLLASFRTSQWAYQAGLRPIQLDLKPLQAGSVALSSRSEALSTGCEAHPTGSEAHPA